MTNFEKQTNRYRNFERDELLEIIVKMENEIWNCKKIQYIKALERKIVKLEKRNKRQQQFIFKHFKFN